MAPETPLRNAMSVDVEDYFHVAAFAGHIRRDSWDGFDCRVPRNVERILELFSASHVRATFFVLGWVAERYPSLIRSICAHGHELASHGYDHTRADSQTPAEFRDDVTRTRGLLEEVSGQQVVGYRAPSFSIGARNLWALDVLHETGHLYSSSINPIHHDLYGVPDAPRFPFRRGSSGILEVPLTTVRVFGLNLPSAGGGFFRLLPYAAFRAAIRRVNSVDGQPVVFYFHPWELDVDQPRVRAGWRSRTRHYLNLSRMESRLQRLLLDHAWDRMDNVFLRDTSVRAVATWQSLSV